MNGYFLELRCQDKLHLLSFLIVKSYNVALLVLVSSYVDIYMYLFSGIVLLEILILM